MNRMWQALIILFSESLWIYYGMSLFASVEMSRAMFLSPLWWGVAGIVGIFLNALLSRRGNTVILLIANALALLVVIIKNWQLVYIEGSWLYALVLSAGLLFTYVRGASFTYREPNRRSMLRAFEGNIIFYAIFALVFIPNEWATTYFHFAFLFAILLSLVGMIISLQLVQEQKDEKINVMKVGQARSFSMILGAFFLIVTLISTLLLLPWTQSALYAAGLSGLNIVKFIGQQIVHLFVAIYSLFPSTEEEYDMPNMMPSDQADLGEMDEEVVFSFPMEWFIAIIVAIAVVIGLIIFAKLIKNWKIPKPKKAQKITITRERLWQKLWSQWIALFRRIKKGWRSRFKRYYTNPVYWYFAKVERWGANHGFERQRTETASEYVEKLISKLAKLEEIEQKEREQLQYDLHRLVQHYEAIYYGSEDDDQSDEYKKVLARLKKIKLIKQDTQAETRKDKQEKIS